MSFRIKLYPSGRRFVAEARETLLEAGLRSGINLPYQCGNGNCGECQATLRAGQVRKARHHDFVITPSPGGERKILLCSHAAESDLELEVMDARESRDIPRQHIRVRLVRTESPVPDVRILHLRTPRSQTLRFLAGQHVALTPAGLPPLDIAIASCPCNGMQLQFHVSANNPHPTARYLFSPPEKGEVLDLTGPYGDFLLREPIRRPIVLLAEGMGFASIKSLMEHIVNLDTRQPVRLFRLAQADHQRYLENHCRAWAEALDDYRYIPLALETALREGEAARAVAAAMLSSWPDLQASDIYLSLPAGLAASLRQQLIGEGMDATRIVTRNLREKPR